MRTIFFELIRWRSLSQPLVSKFAKMTLTFALSKVNVP